MSDTQTDLLPIVVVGAPRSGMPLNPQLTTPGGPRVK